MSIRDLAKEAQVDLGNLSKLEAGKVGYSRDVIDRLAKALNVSVGVLFAEPGVVEAAALHMRQAAILTAEQLATWTGPDSPESEEEPNYLYVPLEKASRHVFALEVKDDQNMPVVQIGDLLVFDARKKPKSGGFVVAQDAAGAIHIGLLRTMEVTRGQSPFEVIPLNDFSRYVSTQDAPGLEIRGTLVELRRSF